MNDRQYRELRDMARVAQCTVSALVQNPAWKLPVWCYTEFSGPAAILSAYNMHKAMAFGAHYGGTVTGRMSSKGPSFQELQRGDANKLLDKMRDEIYRVMLTSCEPLTMKCTKPRDGTSKTVCIDLETQFGVFADANPKDIPPMNTEQLRAALAASEANDAKTAAENERSAYLAYLHGLAIATGKLVNAVRYPSDIQHTFGGYTKELKPLAAELGAKLVPTNVPGNFLVIVG